MRSTSDSLLIDYFTKRSHHHSYTQLTPQNAAIFGYAWVKDISTSVESICLENICYLLTEEGYKLGQVADPENNNLALYGLYMPLTLSHGKKPNNAGPKKIPTR